MGHPRHQHEWRVWEDTELPDGKMRLAAVLHDIERAFEPDEVPPDRTDPISSVYTAWHQERSARVAADWLESQDPPAPPAVVGEVRRLVRVHEDGGDPGADLLQAADSIAFLEIQVDLFLGMVREERLSRAAAERKFRWMFDRVRVPRAREIAAPMLAVALARLGGLEVQ